MTDLLLWYIPRMIGYPALRLNNLKRSGSRQHRELLHVGTKSDPSWPDEEIHLFGPGVASGTFDYFTEAIVGKSGSSRGDYTASEDDNVLVQGVSGDKYGLGFFGLAYYEENSDKLRMVAVDGGEGCIEPSQKL